MENINDLTRDLIDVKNGLKNGTLDMEVAKEINNTAGKILGAIKVQLANRALNMACENRGSVAQSIPYLEEKKCLPTKDVA